MVVVSVDVDEESISIEFFPSNDGRTNVLCSLVFVVVTDGENR